MQLTHGLNQWAIAHGVRVPREDYLEAQAEILLNMQFAPLGEARDFKLVMQVVPLVDDNFQRAFCVGDRFSEGCGVMKSGPDAGPVDFSCQTAHRPKKPVTTSTKVWLREQAVPDESFVNAPTFFLHFPVQILDTFPEG